MIYRVTLQFKNRMVGQVACDMLLLLCDHAEYLLEYYPEVPKIIVEVTIKFVSVKWWISFLFHRRIFQTLSTPYRAIQTVMTRRNVCFTPSPSVSASGA